MKLTTLLAGTVVAIFPLAAAASTLEMRLNDGDLVIADGGADDSSAIEGILAANLGAYSGYESVSVNAVQQMAPPFDQLQADIDVTNLTGGTASIKLEVTAQFVNNVDALWPGQFTATANDVTGSEWDIRSYIGSSAYQQGQLGLSASGALFAESNLILFNANDYWITHVFEHTAGDNVSASANADFNAQPGEISPIPIPAAGFLLIGALGGLAAFRRRKG